MSLTAIFKSSRMFFSSVKKSPDLIKLVLYTKEDCSLCDDAKATIEECYPDQFSIEEVDITKNNRDLFRKFKFDIPVFYHNETFLMKHRVDKDALKNLILKYKE